MPTESEQATAADQPKTEELKSALVEMMNTIGDDPKKMEDAINAIKSVSIPEPTVSEKIRAYGDNILGTKAHLQKQLDEAIPLTGIVITFGDNSFSIRPQSKVIRDIYGEAVQNILSLMDREAQEYHSQADEEYKKESQLKLDTDAS